LLIHRGNQAARSAVEARTSAFFAKHTLGREGESNN